MTPSNPTRDLEARPVRVAVAGAGAFGKNHLRVYRDLELAQQGARLVAAIEPDEARAAETAAKYAIPVFRAAEELLAESEKSGLRVDAASVCVPTVHHFAVAGALLAGGLDVLVEKPIAATVAEADALIALAERGGRILQPGHLERFNPAILATEPALIRPMFFEAHRLSVFTPRSLDVDVVLDLMIHDLDIVLKFANSPVREVRAVGLPILSPKVDIANVRIEFESGCVANFTASRASTERVRKLRFFEPAQYVSIDYARQDALVIRVDGVDGLFARLRELGPQAMADASAALASDASSALPPHPSPGLSFHKPVVSPGEPLRLEIQAFLRAVQTRQQPPVTAQQGRQALALALRITATMAEHAARAGLGDFFRSQ